MIVLEQNRQKFEMCRIPEWHKEGFMGEGIKIVVTESPESSHGQQVANILWQVSPKSDIILRRRPGKRISGGEMTEDSIEKLKDYYNDLYNEGVNILIVSLGGTATEKKEYLIEELLLARYMHLFTSTGNTGKEIRSRVLASLPVSISVGSCRYINNELERAGYSSYGKQVDVYGYSGLYCTRDYERDYENARTGGYFQGTSFANPFVGGMFALYLGWRKWKGLDININFDVFSWLVDRHGERVDEWGKLFKLPPVSEALYSPLQERLAQDRLEGKNRSKRQILRQWGMSEEGANVSADLYEGWWK